MYRLHHVHTPEDGAQFSAGFPTPFDPAVIHRHAVDEHWILLHADDSPAARISLWWRNTPSYHGQRTGVIGQFAASSVAAGKHILEHAIRRLREESRTLVIGPMDGNTWRSYRIITHRGNEPDFFLEPPGSQTLLDVFSNTGFKPLAQYFSALNDDLAFEDQQVATAGARLTKNGIRLRPLNPHDLENELRRIYSVAKVSFQSNFLYTPLPESEVVDAYCRLEGMLQPELILIAEHEHQPVGFVFTLPDWAQQQRGQPIDTVVIKTVAVLPDRRHAGLGASLVAQSQIAARQLGYRKAIHALMHESNSSRNLSARYAQTFRQYALFARKL